MKAETAWWLGCGIVMIAAWVESARAELLVYEPFAYADGILTGQSGALGTTGSWASHEFVFEDWRVHQEGDTSNVGLSGSNSANNPLGFNAFDGTVDNLATSGGYVGLHGAEDVGDPDPHSGEPGRNMDAHIGLDPGVTATFQSNTTTWFSFVSVRGWDRNEESPQFMIGTDFSPDNARGLSYDTAGGGNAIGGGGGPPRANYGDVLPNYFKGGINHSTPGGYLGGVLGGHDGVQDTQGSSATSDGALETGVQTMVWVDNDAAGEFGAPNIVVGRIAWDADANGEDIISVVRFLETDTLSEAAFNALLLAQPALSSANWASNKPDLDQSQFDTLNFSGTKYFVDELRIATTFNDVIGSAPLNLRITRNTPQLDFEWESQAGMLYRLWSSADVTTAISSWDLVVEDLPATAPSGAASILQPVDSVLFYRMEEYPIPPVTVFAENFDGVTAPALPAGWTTGANALDLGTTLWQLGDPSGGADGGPDAANSGANGIGTNLSADYGFDTDIWLRTNAIDLTALTEATLSFQQATEIEEQFDHGSIRILDASDNSELALLEDQSIEGSTNSAWTEYAKALPAEAFNVPIKIEFRFEADNFGTFAGWYLDDLLITHPAP